MAEPPNENHIKRFKFLWRVLMISNLALGDLNQELNTAYSLAIQQEQDRTAAVSLREKLNFFINVGYMFIGAKKRDTRSVNKKKAKDISIKKPKAVVEEVPSSPPAPPPTSPTTSETWDL